MKEFDQDRFRTLLEWSQAHGGTVHPALEVYKDDVTGFSVRVKPASTAATDVVVNSGEEVLACPLSTSLSFLNATTGGPMLSASSERAEPHPVFPPRFMNIQPHVIGHFFLMKQYLMGKDSFWHPYISTLPQPDSISSWSLPPFWPDEDFQFLEGTNAAVAAEEIQGNAKRDFKEARKILKEEGFENWQDYTRHLFNWAFSIFASRSFRPSLVTSKPVQARELPKDVGIDDFSILLPVYDIINHDIKANVCWSVDHQSGGSETCRFITFDSHKPGEQVFNSYGKKTNSELLLSYGFMLPESEGFHNDYVHLRKKESVPVMNGQPRTTERTGTTDLGISEGASPPLAKRQPPKDFLVSLRPMNHPSSFVGQSRNWVATEAGFDIRPEFSHVEDNLVWDLCLSIVGGDAEDIFIDKVLGTAREEQSPAPGHRCGREQEALRKILSGSETFPREVEAVVARVKELLLAKLGMEYDKFCEADPGMGVDEEGNEVEVEVDPQTGNQEIALQYRKQVKNVLENAIGALVPNWKDDMAVGEH
ncbi:putative set domain-containing protein [Diaporthe ampelina]|uniref:Putative set domain-containing protein n=1 Tax=Diaporthe ampelina TaxID=1214573 RepID=A0A0G2FCJ7_9PEZI|nr:putative set domain-containing protein [Diaporthe ampelina]